MRTRQYYPTNTADMKKDNPDPVPRVQVNHNRPPRVAPNTTTEHVGIINKKEHGRFPRVIPTAAKDKETTAQKEKQS
eukprot:13425841-Ditylum_brightwellii.AAC.1